jgi:hypothetical protein
MDGSVKKSDSKKKRKGKKKSKNKDIENDDAPAQEE